MKTSSFNLKDPYVFALFLVICFVLVALARSVYTVSPELGGDALRKWETARLLAETGNFEELILDRHHSARWGSNFPMAVLIKVSGYTITNYLILPLLLYAGIYTLMMGFAVRKSFLTASLVALGVFLFYEPMFFRASSQTQPFVFGIFYLTVALWAMDRYLEHGRMRMLLLSAFFAFCTYGAKESYVFFYPGLFFLLLMRGRFRDCIIYAIALLFLLFLETLMFNAVSDGMKFGRIEYLATGHHLKAMQVKANFGGYPVWEFISRRWLDVKPFGQFIAAVSTIYFIYLLVSRKLFEVDNLSLGIILMVMSYCFVMTFVPYKINPLLPLQPLHQKYMATVMPYLVFCCIYALNDLLLALQGSRKKIASYSVIVLSVVFLLYSAVQESPIKYKFRYLYPTKDAFIYNKDSYIDEFVAKWNDGYGFCAGRWKIRHNIFYWLRIYLDYSGQNPEFKVSKVHGLRIFHSEDYRYGELKGLMEGWELERLLAVERCDLSVLETN